MASSSASAMAILSYQRREKPGKKEIAEAAVETAGDGTDWEDLVK
jgi:hypothetical protein